MFIEIGTLTIPTIWLSVLAALFITSVIHKFLTGVKVEDWYWNGFFLYFLTWKLSYILFHLEMFINFPLSIIYFNGGSKGHYLGLLFLVLYLFLLTRKKYPAILEYLSHSILLFFILFEVIIHLLEREWNESAAHLVAFVIYLIVFFIFEKKNDVLSGLVITSLILLELFILSFFTSLLTVESFTFIILGFTVLVLSKNRYGGRNI